VTKAEIKVVGQADFTQFERALAQAKRSSDAMTGGVVTSFRSVRSVIAAATAAAAALSGALAIESIASYKGLSEQIGDTAEAVSGLQAASDLSGVALDSVAAASVRLTASLSKGGPEAEGVARALGAIGIESEAFKRASPVEQLEQIALGLAKFEDGAGKTAVAVRLFGRSGAELIPFLNDLADAGGRQVRLTQEQIIAADQFTKGLAKLQTEVKDLARAFAAVLLPSLNTTLERFNEIRRQGVGLFDAIVGTAAPGLALSNIGESIGALLKESDKLTKQLLNPPIIFRNDKNWSDQQRARIKEINVEIAEFRRQRDLLLGTPPALKLPEVDDGALAGLRKTLEASGLGEKPEAKKLTEADRYLESLQKQFEATQKLTVYEQLFADVQAKRIDGITPKLLEQLAITARQIDAAKQYAEDQADVKKVLDDLAAAAERKQKQDEADNKLLKAKAEAYLDLADPMREFIRRLEEIDALKIDGFLTEDEARSIKRSLGEVLKPLEEIDEYARNAAQSMQQALADYLFDPFKDGIKGLGDQFSKLVQRMVADALAAQLMKALFGDFAQTGVVGGILGGVATQAAAPITVATPSSGASSGPAVKSSGTVIYQTNNFTPQQSSSDWRVQQTLKDATISAVDEKRARSSGWNS